MSNKFNLGEKFNNVLNADIIKTWEGENVILNGATGSGKTYFSMHNLYTYCRNTGKNILFLCNRYELFKDVILEKTDLCLRNFDVMLYQTLEEKLKKKEEIKKYDCIVLDEFHHVLEASCYNCYTDKSYYWIINQKQAIKIFMSGTGKVIFNKLKHDKIVKEQFEYIIPYDYSYANIKVYKQRKNVYDIINNVINNTDEKLIYFADSIKNALEVYEQFKEYSNFRCSENNKKAKEYNELDCIKTYEKNLITFDKRILITTKVLDNGINLIDRKIKHIICDIFDFQSKQQSFGRKRKIDKEDKCTFYLYDYNKGDLRNYLGGISKNLNPIIDFIYHKEKFKEKYDSNRFYHSNFIFHDEDGKRVYNDLAFWNMLVQQEDIRMAQQNGYANTFINILGDTVNSVEPLEDLEEYQMKNEIELYLIDIKGKRLFKEDQIKLAEMLNIKDKRNRILFSYKILSAYIHENFKLALLSCRDKKRRLLNGNLNPDYDKTYWILSNEYID